VLETSFRLGIAPVCGAFATPINRRFRGFWTKADDAFAQEWYYPHADAMRANPPFSRLEEVVAKAFREGCLMLVVAPDWTGTGYPWCSAVSALFPKKWYFPEGRAVFLRGGTVLMPGPLWRT